MEKALKTVAVCMVVSSAIIAAAVIYHARTGRFQFQPHNMPGVVRTIDTVTGEVKIQN